MMKLKFGTLFLGLLLTFSALNAQDVTTVEAKNADISENLDLEVVASVFGEAKDLEDFEKRLNDPEKKISNLDLNEDGEVDYLRVVEASKGDTHVITIQAVIGKDQYQDVATIDVEKDSKGETQVQVVGDVYMYGPNYIIEPVYVHPPVIWVWFWGPLYRPWRSPYYWGYYPPYYRPWHPFPPHRYRTNVHVHINVNNTYRTTNVRRSTTSVNIQNTTSRNDYAKRNPDRSFEKRNTGVSNRAELSKQNTRQVNNDVKKRNAVPSTGREVQKDWKPQSERSGTQSNVRDGKVSVPTQKPSTRQSTQPAQRPSTRQSSQPTQRPSAPAAKPATRQAPKPAAKPAARPSPKRR